MRTILYLDLASTTGYALRRFDGSFLSGIQKFRHSTKCKRGWIFERFSAWIQGVIKLQEPSEVVFEMPHQRGRAATRLLCGLAAIVEKECDTRQIPHREAHSATVKAFSTGKGNATKPEVQAAIEKIMKRPMTDDNEADAVAVMLADEAGALKACEERAAARRKKKRAKAPTLTT